MASAFLVAVLAIALAAFTYLRLERIGTRGRVPLAFRAVAWTAIGLLILNVSCPAPGSPQRPLVLLDGSLSLSGPGGHWAAARDTAARLGDIRLFGDERTGGDTAPTRGRSLLGPALTAAAASARPVLVVTDGEIADAGDLAPELLGRIGIRVMPRDTQPDRAVTSVTGPARVTAGDTIQLELEVQTVGGEPAESARVEVFSGSSRLGARTVRLERGSGRGRFAVPSATIGAGDHLLRIRLAEADAEPRTDVRLHLVTVAPTPGVVLLAATPDWDSRFLYQHLKDVAELPLRGFVQIEGERWRSMADLRVVPREQVRQAARRADLLIVKGEVGSIADGSTARGIWTWPGADAAGSAIPGDWYLSAAEVSPVAGAFLGQPVDSFPPASRLIPYQSTAGDWVALTAQLGRRGAVRPAVVGREQGRTRRTIVTVDGLWRWGFRGGSSEQSYRAWVAATTSWLLGAADSVRGPVRPVRPVVGNGRPIVFEWIASGPARPLAIAWTRDTAQRTDTLRFDGAGRATVWLDPGEYRYRVQGGGTGAAAVESYSDELLPQRVTLSSREPRVSRPSGRTAARDWLWLFGLTIVALGGEWFARRRLGLR